MIIDIVADTFDNFSFPLNLNNIDVITVKKNRNVHRMCRRYHIWDILVYKSENMSPTVLSADLTELRRL